MTTENKDTQGKKQATKKEADHFDGTDYYKEHEVLDGDEVKKVKVYNDPYKKKGTIARGKLRAAQALDVTISHLEESVKILNGRKIQGFFATDLIGRYGYFDGVTVSRSDLGRKYKKNASAVDLATMKLMEIIRFDDVKSAYALYLKEIEIEESHEKKESTREGE